MKLPRPVRRSLAGLLRLIRRSRTHPPRDVEPGPGVLKFDDLLPPVARGRPHEDDDE